MIKCYYLNSGIIIMCNESDDNETLVDALNIRVRNDKIQGMIIEAVPLAFPIGINLVTLLKSDVDIMFEIPTDETLIKLYHDQLAIMNSPNIIQPQKSKLILN
ncbi:MAG: hypothetical protein ABSG25_01605 [Bryobacteraceae bacterium]